MFFVLDLGYRFFSNRDEALFPALQEISFGNLLFNFIPIARIMIEDHAVFHTGYDYQVTQSSLRIEFVMNGHDNRTIR